MLLFADVCSTTLSAAHGAFARELRPAVLAAGSRTVSIVSEMTFQSSQPHHFEIGISNHSDHSTARG